MKYIATDKIILTIPDIPIIPNTHISACTFNRGTVDQIIMKEHCIMDEFVRRVIIGIHHGMNLHPKFFSSCFGMGGITIVKDEKQALVAQDIRIITIFRVIMTIIVHIHKWCQVGRIAIVFRTMCRPCEYILGYLITRLAMVGDELFYLTTSEIPNMMIVFLYHGIRATALNSERTHPVITTFLVIPISGQMNLIVDIHSSNP